VSVARPGIYPGRANRFVPRCPTSTCSHLFPTGTCSFREPPPPDRVSRVRRIIQLSTECFRWSS